jgi:hypothetical protein
VDAISEKINLDAAHPYKLESVESSRVLVDIEINIEIPA